MLAMTASLSRPYLRARGAVGASGLARIDAAGYYPRPRDELQLRCRFRRLRTDCGLPEPRHRRGEPLQSPGMRMRGLEPPRDCSPGWRAVRRSGGRWLGYAVSVSPLGDTALTSVGRLRGVWARNGHGAHPRSSDGGRFGPKRVGTGGQTTTTVLLA